MESRYRPFSGIDDWLRLRVNRRRWDEQAQRLKRVREAAGEQAWRSTQNRLLQLAAFDTGALDGLYPANPQLTTRIADPAVDLGHPVGAVSPGLAAFTNAQLEAYRGVLEAAETGHPLDTALIKRFHKALVGAQETFLLLTPTGEVQAPLPRGVYKTFVNYYANADGTIGAYAPPGRVAEEMERLMAELRRITTDDHVAVVAAYAHNAVARIHPFADGNGRVGRALASYFFAATMDLPLVVLADQWPMYLQVLMRSDQDDRQALVDFMFARGMDAMDLATNVLVAGERPIEVPAPNVHQIDQPTVQRAASRLVFDALWAELRERLTSPPIGVRLSLEPVNAPSPVALESDLLAVTDPETQNTQVVLALVRDEPVPVMVRRSYRPAVSIDDNDPMPVCIVEESRGRRFQLSLGDVDPLFTDMGRVRLRAWMAAEIADAYRQLDSS